MNWYWAGVSVRFEHRWSNSDSVCRRGQTQMRRPTSSVASQIWAALHKHPAFAGSAKSSGVVSQPDTTPESETDQAPIAIGSRHIQ